MPHPEAQYDPNKRMEIVFSPNGIAMESYREFDVSDLERGERLFLRTASGNIYLVRFLEVQETGEMPEQKEGEPLRVRVPEVKSIDYKFEVTDAKGTFEKANNGNPPLFDITDFKNHIIERGSILNMKARPFGRPSDTTSTTPISEIVLSKPNREVIVINENDPGVKFSTIANDFLNIKKFSVSK